MPFMLKYADLFIRSDSIQKIIPRQLSTVEEFQYFHPTLLNESSSQANKDL